jgi:hypothetical protein
MDRYRSHLEYNMYLFLSSNMIFKVVHYHIGNDSHVIYAKTYDDLRFDPWACACACNDFNPRPSDSLQISRSPRQTSKTYNTPLQPLFCPSIWDSCDLSGRYCHRLQTIFHPATDLDSVFTLIRPPLWEIPNHQSQNGRFRAQAK